MHKQSSSAISFAFFSSKSANLRRCAARWAPVYLLHGPDLNAVSAAATAASISASPATCTAAGILDSSKGLTSVSVSPDWELTNYIVQYVIEAVHENGVPHC